MGIPSISSGSDSEEDEEPIFSNFKWDTVQVEEPGFSGITSNQCSLAEDPPLARSTAGLLSSAPARTAPITELQNRFVADANVSQSHGRQQQARQVIEPEPLIPSTSPHSGLSTAPDLLQNVGWFAGAAGCLADVFSPRSQTRLVDGQDTHQGSVPLNPAQALATTAAATAAEAVAANLQGSSTADQEQQDMLSARFHAMVDAHCIGAEQVAIQDPLELEEPLEQVELSELDALIGRLQAGAVMDLSATRPADLPDPSTLFSDDDGSSSDAKTGVRSSRAAATPLAGSSAATAAAASPCPLALSAAQGPLSAGSAEAVTLVPQSPSSSSSLHSLYPRPPPSPQSVSARASPRLPPQHPPSLAAASQHLHSPGLRSTSSQAVPRAPLPIRQEPVTEFFNNKPKPPPRLTVKVDLKASISSSLQQQQQQQQQRHYHHHHHHHHVQASTGRDDRERTQLRGWGDDGQQQDAGSSSSYSGSRRSSSSACSDGSDDSEDWAAMRRQMKAQGAQASGLQLNQPNSLPRPPGFPRSGSAGRATPTQPLPPKFASINGSSIKSNTKPAASAAAASSIDNNTLPAHLLPPKFSSKGTGSSNSSSGVPAAATAATSGNRSDGHATAVQPLARKFASNNGSKSCSGVTAAAASSRDGHATAVQPLAPKFASSNGSQSSSDVRAAAPSSRDGHATPVQHPPPKFASSNGSSCAVSGSAGGDVGVSSAGESVSTISGMSTGTDVEDVGKATGATRSLFCCTDDLPPLEPKLPSSHTRHTDANPAILLQQQQAESDECWQQQGSYISSSGESSNEDEGGGWTGAAAARPGARRALLKSGHACAAAPPSGIGTPQGVPPNTCASTASGSPHPNDHSNPSSKPSYPQNAWHLAPHTYSTPNKTIPDPGLWESNLPTGSMATPGSSAQCTPVVSRMRTQTSTPSEQSQHPKHSTSAKISGADLDSEDGLETQLQCQTRGLAYGLPKHAPGSSDAQEEGVVFVQAGTRIRYPAEPPTSKLAGVQRNLVQRQPATMDAGTGTT